MEGKKKNIIKVIIVLLLKGNDYDKNMFRAIAFTDLTQRQATVVPLTEF